MRSTQIPCWENEELGRNKHPKPVISGAHEVVVVHPAIQLGRHDRGLHLAKIVWISAALSRTRLSTRGASL